MWRQSISSEIHSLKGHQVRMGGMNKNSTMIYLVWRMMMQRIGNNLPRRMRDGKRNHH